MWRTICRFIIRRLHKNELQLLALISSEGIEVMSRLDQTYKEARDLGNYGFCQISSGGYIVLDGAESGLFAALSDAREVQTREEAKQLANFLSGVRLARMGRDPDLVDIVFRRIGEMPANLARVALG